MGHVASESSLWRTQQATKAQRGGRMSSSAAYSGSLSSPHLASVELPGGLVEPCPLSGLTSSGVSVNGIPSSGCLHFEGQLKTRVSHKATLWATWPLNGIGSCSVWASLGPGCPCTDSAFHSPTQVPLLWLWLCLSILSPVLFQPGC